MEDYNIWNKIYHQQTIIYMHVDLCIHYSEIIIDV